MKGTLEKAFGYQGDNMNLPVGDLAAALPFYETVLGFRVVTREDLPHKSAVLARDDVQMRLSENGGDSFAGRLRISCEGFDVTIRRIQGQRFAEGTFRFQDRTARRCRVERVLRRRA